LHAVLLELQYDMGKVASYIEKSKNMWNWTDPRITLFANFFLLCVAALLSSIIYLMGYILIWVPLNVFVLVFGLIALLPPSVKGWHIKAVPTAKTSEAQEETQPTEAASQPSWITKILQWIDNLYERVPDNDEVVHRIISDGQLSFSTVEPTSDKIDKKDIIA